jgi:hypothetical protein
MKSYSDKDLQGIRLKPKSLQKDLSPNPCLPANLLAQETVFSNSNRYDLEQPLIGGLR